MRILRVSVSALESTVRAIIEVLILRGLYRAPSHRASRGSSRRTLSLGPYSTNRSKEKDRQPSRSQNSFALLTKRYFSTPASFVKDDLRTGGDGHFGAPHARSRAQGFGVGAWGARAGDRDRESVV